MPADRHRYPPLRPRRLAGVRVDHSRQVGAGRTGVRLAIDFEPLPEDAAGGYTFAVDAPAPERALPRKPIERLGWQLGREWEEEGYLREVFAVRAVLRRAEWWELRAPHPMLDLRIPAPRSVRRLAGHRRGVAGHLRRVLPATAVPPGDHSATTASGPLRQSREVQP